MAFSCISLDGILEMGDTLGAQCQWTWLDNAAVRQSRQVVFFAVIVVL